MRASNEFASRGKPAPTPWHATSLFAERSYKGSGGPGEGPEERDQIALLGSGESERHDLLIQVRTRCAAVVVVFDDVFERRQAPIVHVGGRVLDVAKRGHFEGTSIFVPSRHDLTAQVARAPREHPATQRLEERQ